LVIYCNIDVLSQHYLTVLPSLHRLSVRNLPTQLNEKQLKTLFLKAAGGPSAVIKQVFCAIRIVLFCSIYLNALLKSNIVCSFANG